MVSRGTLPRQLLLEILDSIQMVLFPVGDKKSRKILRSLVSLPTEGFDPDCLRLESMSIRKLEEREISYQFFGARLAELYNELENPRPHGTLQKWLERRSGARHATLIALAGVFLALLLGAATLAVSIYQAWLSHQAWKHPVSSDATAR